MDYEKKYKEALERARICHKDMCNLDGVVANMAKDFFEEVFPELKESEDDRIRREMIEIIKNEAHEFPSSVIANKSDSWIAWLEKQGEQKPIISNNALGEGIAHFGITQYQIDNWLKKYVDVEKQSEYKPTDEVKPKFKAGDWIINPETGNVLQIKNILLCGNKGNYEFDNSSMPIKSVDGHYKQWTIQDAKDGDVLAIEWKDECQWQKIVIFKSLNEFGVEGYGNTFKNNKLAFKVDVPCYSKTWTKHLHPATKEQRDLLFTKMKEAGYEWDADKKELKKIEQESVWSEEDEEMINAVIDAIQFTQKEHNHEVNQIVYEREIDWLKSLKDRVYPKHEWSEEDEVGLGDAMWAIEQAKGIAKDENDMGNLS